MVNSFALLILFVQLKITFSSSILDTFTRCRGDESFGNSTFVCDPDHNLPDSVVSELDNLLNVLQDKVKCDCENKCFRGEGLTDKYIALMLITNTTEVDKSGGKDALKETTKRVYENAKLGSDECDNGLIILYIKDQKKLAVYRGKDRFTLLTDQDMAKLHQLSTTTNSKDREALLLNGSALNEKRVDLAAENWIPILGLILATILILIILLFLIIFASKLCIRRGNSKTKSNMKLYANNQFAPYKTMEPIYIPTPTLISDMYAPACYAHPMGIPYTTPITPSTIYHPRSRSATPTSAQMIRRDMTNVASGPPSSKYSSTPQVEKREKPPRNYVPTNNKFSGMNANEQKNLDQTSSRENKPTFEINELPFLDPRRKLEVQTKEEFID